MLIVFTVYAMTPVSIFPLLLLLEAEGEHLGEDLLLLLPEPLQPRGLGLLAHTQREAELILLWRLLALSDLWSNPGWPLRWRLTIHIAHTRLEQMSLYSL